MTTNDKWINRIQQKMEHYEADVPEGLYDDIVAEMQRRGLKPLAATSHKAPVVPLWTQRIAALAAVAAAVVVAVFVLTPSAPEMAPTASLPTTHAVQPTAVATATDIQTAGEPSSLVSAVRRWKATLSPAAVKEMMLADNTTPAATTPIYNIEPEPECEVMEQRPTNADSQTATKPAATSKPVSPSGSTVRKTERRVIHYPSTRRSHPMSIGAYVRGAQSGNSVIPSELPAGSGFLADNDVYGSGDMIHPSRVPVLPMGRSGVRTHHKLPVKGGLSLRYSLDDRWSVQTGVNYSYHSSEIEMGGEDIDQQLHFIGVPVAVGYNVWGNRHVNVYLTAGGEVEKLVKGRRTVSYTGQQCNEDVKMSRPQLSVQMSAGAEYRATRAVSLYIEPGVSYHFDNGSGVSTIYSDKPFEFGLSMGVRVDINRR